MTKLLSELRNLQKHWTPLLKDRCHGSNPALFGSSTLLIDRPSKRNYVSEPIDFICKDSKLEKEYDAVIVGAGHNGLISAAYLQKAGLKTCVLERRYVIGGACVTEEIFPGFKFSRASYLLSLLRPQIVEDLKLKEHGLRVFLRNPNSYTPLREPINNARSLTLSADSKENELQIAQFSQRDAKNFIEYEHQLARIIDALDPLLDTGPPAILNWSNMSLKEKIYTLFSARPLISSVSNLGSDSAAFYQVMTSSATKTLNHWFESEPLKATLATDSVIGAMLSPHMSGSGYVLLHHVMGYLEGVRGAWGYVQGGMGSVSNAIARSAKSHGASIFVNKPVRNITSKDGKVTGVSLEDGSEVKSKMVLSNATAKVTFVDLLEKGVLPSEFQKEVSEIDYTSPVTKINVAVSRCPNFLADPNIENKPGSHLNGTIHLNCENTELIHDAYLDAANGCISEKPVIEITIPSCMDSTLAPEGAHVVQFFTQFTPYKLSGGKQWTDETKLDYAKKVFRTVDVYAPGFSDSVIGWDILTPPDLEQIFGLTGGNIFHGAMSLDQLFFSRPLPQCCDYRSPLKGLYLCGSAAHPGGGVMGSAGRLAANEALTDFKGSK